MRRFSIVNRTSYAYTGPVRLGPHTLRLRPREGHDLRIESASLSIQPEASLRWHRDAEDNCLAIATFNGCGDELLLESHLSILQYDHEPLNFVVEDYAVDYPFQYAPNDRPLLEAYLTSASV